MDKRLESIIERRRFLEAHGWKHKKVCFHVYEREIHGKVIKLTGGMAVELTNRLILPKEPANG